MSIGAIAQMLLSKFGTFIKTKAIAIAVAEKILDVIGVTDFFDNRTKLKEYYKLIRDYGMVISKD